MKLSIKKGDFVKVIAGQDKGKTAQVTGVNPTSGRITVEGKDLVVVKKAHKSRKANDKSGIIEISRTMDASNVMPICSVCGKATRVKHTVDANGKKVRVCECGAVLETKKAAKDEKKAKATVRKRTKKAEETVAAPETAPAAEEAVKTEE